MKVRGSTIAALAAVLCLGVPAIAHAAETVTITKAGFSPDVLGAPTNVFGSATIGSTSGPVPAPITHVNVLGPAGVTLDLAGSTTCSETALSRIGSEACPLNSRAGTGGGEGIYELGGELVKEKYTLDFLLSDNRPGHTEMLILLKGSTPVAIEIVFKAVVIQGPAPYGLGFSLDVPLIKVLPDASDASATNSFLQLGAHNLTYFRKVHGKRVRTRVRGIVLPRRCPRAGWPVATQISFQDGSTVMARRTVACPKR